MKPIEDRFFDFAIWLIAASVLLAMLTGSMNKAQAGRKGGKQTFAKHGREHMQKIGARGAATTWTRYNLAPIGQSGWAMVSRETNEVKTFINYIPGR